MVWCSPRVQSSDIMASRDLDEGVRTGFAPSRGARHRALRRVRRRAHRGAETDGVPLPGGRASVEIYVALVAALFAGLGIWLGLTLTRKKPTTISPEIPAQTADPFVADEARVRQLGITRARAGDSGAHRRRVEQPGDCRAAVRQREHGEDPFKPAVR